MQLGSLVGGGLAALSISLATVAAGQAARTLTASPPVVQAGQSVTIAGTDLDECPSQAGSLIGLFANNSQLGSATLTDSAFQQSITIPAGTPGGPLSVTAQCPSDPPNPPTVLGVASLTVVTLVLSPASALPGTTITASGYADCPEVEVTLVRDGTAVVGDPVEVPGDNFGAQLTVPASAVPGDDYQVEDECDAGPSSVALNPAVLAVEPFTVTTPVASPSPTPATSSPSPSPSPVSSSPSPSVSATTPPPRIRSGGSSWTPAALIGGSSAGAVLIALAGVRASSLVRGRRGRAWVRKHMRAVAGQSGSVSANVQDRPGAASVSVSVGLQPHSDPIGHQHGEEASP